MYHRHDEKEPNREPGGVRSGAGVRRSGLSQESPARPRPGGRRSAGCGGGGGWRRSSPGCGRGGEPVQQRAGEAFRSEDRSPLVEGQVGGDQDGAPFVALAPTAMTFSRRWMHPHRASSIARALFTDGMAGRSKVSRLFHMEGDDWREQSGRGSDYAAKWPVSSAETGERGNRRVNI